MEKKYQKFFKKDFLDIFKNEGIEKLRNAQKKAIDSGLFDRKNLLICTPTASGKTLIGEFAFINSIINNDGKTIYIVPLKALASEKFKEFKRKYSKLFRIAISIGDMDSKETRLGEYDLIICTSEKLDSIIRHKTPWLNNVSTIVIDEIHLLNDHYRGPTLEIIMTLMRKIIPSLQIIGLSATIGNPKQLADWMKAELILDDWRPVELKKGVYLDGEVDFY